MPPKTPTRSGRSKSPSGKKTPRGKSPARGKSPSSKSPSVPPKPAPAPTPAPPTMGMPMPMPMPMPMNSAMRFAPPPSKMPPVPNKKNDPPYSFLRDTVGRFIMVMVCMIIIPMLAIYSRKGKAQSLGWPWPAVVLVASALSSCYMQGTYQMSIGMVIMAELYLAITWLFYQ